MLRGHDAVRAAIGLAGDDGDFRDGGFGEGEKQLGAVPDDPAEFLLGARQEAGDILESNQRNIESVAKTNEAGTFDGSVDIEDACENSWLIADDADRPSVKPRKAHNEVLCVVFVDFEEKSVVNDGMDSVLDVVRLLRIGRNESVERFVAASWRV